MAHQSDDDLLDAVVICQGNIGDPGFDLNFMKVVKKLNSLVCEDYKAIKVRKVEPWNSVRVTLSLPRDAAQKLRHLAQQGDLTLRELGILSVQVEGDQVISLTIAGQYNEPQEIILHTEDRPVHPPCQDSVCDNQTPSKSMVQLLVEASGGGGETSGIFGSGSEQFRSPNVVVPLSEPVPFIPKSLGPSMRSGTNYGPFPFTSMTHAAHAMQNREVHHPVLNNKKHISPPPPYPGTCNSSGIKVQESPLVSIVSTPSATSNAPVNYSFSVTNESAVLTNAFASASTSQNKVNSDQIANSSGSLLVNLLQSDHSSGTAGTQKSVSCESKKFKLNEDNVPPSTLPMSCNSSPALHSDELITYAVSRHTNQLYSSQPSNLSKSAETVPSTSRKMSDVIKSVSAFKNHQKSLKQYHNSGQIDLVQSSSKLNLYHNKGFDQEIGSDSLGKVLSSSLTSSNQSQPINVLDVHLTSGSTDFNVPDTYKSDLCPQRDFKLQKCRIDKRHTDRSVPLSNESLGIFPPNSKPVNHIDTNQKSAEFSTGQVQTKSVNLCRENSVPVSCHMNFGSPSPNQFTSSGKQRQFLINPLTGHLEPAPTDSSSDSETESVLCFTKKTDSTKLCEADREHSDSEILLKSMVESQSKKKTYLERSKSCDDNTMSESCQNAGEKIKLRLKLGKKEPVTTSYCVDTCGLSPKLNDAKWIGNKHSFSGSSTSEGGIPPLRISLRGKKAAVVVRPRDLEKEERGLNNEFDSDSSMTDKLKDNASSKYLVSAYDDKPPKFKMENTIIKYRSKNLKKLSAVKSLPDEMLSHFDFKNEDVPEFHNILSSQNVIPEFSSKIKERRNKMEKLQGSSIHDDKQVSMKPTYSKSDSGALKWKDIPGIQKNMFSKSGILKSTLEASFCSVPDFNQDHSSGEGKDYKVANSGVSEMAKPKSVDIQSPFPEKKSYKMKQPSSVTINQTPDDLKCNQFPTSEPSQFKCTLDTSEAKLKLVYGHSLEDSSVSVCKPNSRLKFTNLPSSESLYPSFIVSTNKSAMSDKARTANEDLKCPEVTPQNSKDYFNQGSTQGDDSGIESMDTQSEKSPNQGESPVRRDDKDAENSYRHNKAGETKNISQSKNERNSGICNTLEELGLDEVNKESDNGQPSECNSDATAETIMSSETNIEINNQCVPSPSKTDTFTAQSPLPLLQVSKVLDSSVPDHSESGSLNSTPVLGIPPISTKNAKLDTVISRLSASSEAKMKSTGNSKPFLLLPGDSSMALSSKLDIGQLNGDITDHTIAENGTAVSNLYIDTSVPKAVPSTIPVTVGEESHSQKSNSVIFPRPYVITHGTKVFPITLPTALCCDHHEMTSGNLKTFDSLSSVGDSSSKIVAPSVTSDVSESKQSDDSLPDKKFPKSMITEKIEDWCEPNIPRRPNLGNCIESKNISNDNQKNERLDGKDSCSAKLEDYSFDCEAFSPIIEDPQPVHKNPPRYTYGSSTKLKEPLSPLDLGNCSDDDVQDEELESSKSREEDENVPSFSAQDIPLSSPAGEEESQDKDKDIKDQLGVSSPVMNDAVATDHNYVTRSKHSSGSVGELMIEIPSDSPEDVKRPTRSSSRNAMRLSSPKLPSLVDSKCQELSVHKRNCKDDLSEVKSVVGVSPSSLSLLVQSHRNKRKRNDSDSSEASKCSESSKKEDNELTECELLKLPKKKVPEAPEVVQACLDEEVTMKKVSGINRRDADKNSIGYTHKEEEPNVKTKTLRNIQSDNQEQANLKCTSKTKNNKEEEPKGTRKLKDVEKSNVRGLCKANKHDKHNVEVNKRDTRVDKDALTYKTYVKKDFVERNNIFDKAFGNKNKVRTELETGSKRQTRSSGSTG